MGHDLNGDERATHGVSREVLDAEIMKARAELQSLDLDADRKLAEVAPEILTERTRTRAELARLEEAARPRFEIRRLADRGIDLARLPPPAPVLLTLDGGKPFMRSGVVASLVAPGGTGKTFALVQLACAIGSGTPWLGTYQPTRKGAVLLALAEEDDDEVQRRMYQATRGLDEYQRGEVLRNVAALGLAGRDVSFLRRTPDKNIAAAAWFSTFKPELAAKGPWRAVILDPWSRWGGVDAETDAHAATYGVRLLEELTKLEGAPAVIVAHHTRKASKGSTGPADASDARGSSAFVDGGRFTMNLGRHRESALLSLRVTKTNGTVPGPELILARGEGGVLRPATPSERASEQDANASPTRTRSTPPRAEPSRATSGPGW